VSQSRNCNRDFAQAELAVKLGTPLKTLADVIHPFPAFDRVLGKSVAELAAKAASEVRP
jgi:hypothetical protein